MMVPHHVVDMLIVGGRVLLRERGQGSWGRSWEFGARMGRGRQRGVCGKCEK